MIRPGLKLAIAPMTRIALIALSLLVSNLWAMQAHANAARVEFSIGDVSGIDSAGTSRRLAKGSTLSAGDTVRTARGRAQIRFTDGGYTSLQPNTEFRIDDYHYDEKKAEESVSFFSLLKGGLRTITGVIGKIRKKAYQLRTPVATVGIRGTEYLAVLGNSLTVHVGEGEIEVCNKVACTPFGAHQTGYVASPGSRAVLAEHPPSLAPPQERQVYAYNGGYQAQFDQGATLSSSDTRTPLPDGPFYALAVSWGQSASNTDLFAAGLFSPPDSLTSASFDGNAGLSEYFNGFGTLPVSGNAGSAQVVDIGYADGPVGWGRWTAGGATVGVSGGGSSSVNLTGSSSQHYIVGIPTPVMPTNPATYSLAGATNPTLASGSGAPGTLNSANLSADFASGAVSLNMDMTVDGSNYITTNLPMRLLNAPNDFRFAGSGITNSSNCISSCFTSVDGFFAGEDASHAGLAYKTDLGGIDVINGAAAFKKD
jgi:hypothetical protein